MFYLSAISPGDEAEGNNENQESETREQETSSSSNDSGNDIAAEDEANKNAEQEASSSSNGSPQGNAAEDGANKKRKEEPSNSSNIAAENNANKRQKVETCGLSRDQERLAKLVHAFQCSGIECSSQICAEIRGEIGHEKWCIKADCPLNLQLASTCKRHARRCEDVQCPVLFCFEFKHGRSYAWAKGEMLMKVCVFDVASSICIPTNSCPIPLNNQKKPRERPAPRVAVPLVTRDDGWVSGNFVEGRELERQLRLERSYFLDDIAGDFMELAHIMCGGCTVLTTKVAVFLCLYEYIIICSMIYLVLVAAVLGYIRKCIFK